MPNDVWRFLRDPNEQRKIVNSLIDVANRGLVSGTLGAPVDMATQAANLLVAGGGYAGHKLGLLDQPPELIDPQKVPGSSEWIGNKMQRAGLLGDYRNPIAELGTAMLSPVAARGAMKAGGLLAQADLAGAANAAKVPPAGPIARQRGMIKVGRERIPETSEEIDKLHSLLRERADAAGIKTSEGASNISGSRYMTFDRGEDVPPVQVRISNHADFHPNSFLDGERYSVDPVSGNTYESAVKWLGEQGVSLSAKKNVSLQDWMPSHYAPFVQDAAKKLMAKGVSAARLMDKNKGGQELMWEAHKLRQQYYGADPYGDAVRSDEPYP